MPEVGKAYVLHCAVPKNWGVRLKKFVANIDAAPTKRVYLSIIADYSPKTALCELIDNSLDAWRASGRSERLAVSLEFNYEQQTITVTDDAGGVAEENLPVIVSPGRTDNKPESVGIGIFGVGTKRAVVAIAQEVSIRTRARGTRKTFMVEYSDEWLKTDDWLIPYYEVGATGDGNTVVEMKKLRSEIKKDGEFEFLQHFGETYCRFIRDREIHLTVNGTAVDPIDFEDWAFPPTFEPIEYTAEFEVPNAGKMNMVATCGLTKHASPKGEYGVYMYCNKRLVVRALKDQSVGFSPGVVGSPDPKISLLRAIVRLDGPAAGMPWTSNKTGIKFDHDTFRTIREWLTAVLAEWASLSRRLSGTWDETVAAYPKGKIQHKRVTSILNSRKSYLPPLPPAYAPLAQAIPRRNSAIVDAKPWTRGLVGSIAAVEILNRKSFDEKNRLLLIILDSTLEIAMKEYLVREAPGGIAESRLRPLFANRKDVQKEVAKSCPMTAQFWQQVDYYYDQRCKLVHEKASVTVDEREIEKFRALVDRALDRFFGLRTSPD